MTALHDKFACSPITYGETIAAIDPKMQAAATDAEMHSCGTGLAYILNQLKLGDSNDIPY